MCLPDFREEVARKRQDRAEKAKLLKGYFRTAGLTLEVYSRKPFDLSFQKAKTEEWRARRDSNTRHSA
jgi:hypothetical protein